MENRYLIDTHIFLWWLNGDKRLKPSIKQLLKNPQNQIYVSVASLWEISIKQGNGKLRLKTNAHEMISVFGCVVLPITQMHVVEIEKLPLLHNDPFDRMLIAQAKVENLIFITDDAKIRKYDVRTL